MPVENATYVNQLNRNYPSGTERKYEGDDHLRLLKSTIQNTFQNIKVFALVSATNSSDTYNVSLTSYTNYVDDTFLVFKPDVTNSGSCFLRINTFTPLPLLDINGDQLSASALVGNKPYFVWINSGTAYVLYSTMLLTNIIDGGTW